VGDGWNGINYRSPFNFISLFSHCEGVPFANSSLRIKETKRETTLKQRILVNLGPSICTEGKLLNNIIQENPV